MHVSKSSFIICEAWTMHLTQSEISASGLRTLPQAGFRIAIFVRCVSQRSSTLQESFNRRIFDIDQVVQTMSVSDAQRTFIGTFRSHSTNTNIWTQCWWPHSRL